MYDVKFIVTCGRRDKIEKTEKSFDTLRGALVYASECVALGHVTTICVTRKLYIYDSEQEKLVVA